MNYKEFFKLVDKLDRNKYHICCEIINTNDCRWVIFDKNMPPEEYWSANNKPLLDSRYNTIEDLIDFINRSIVNV